jgi:phage shock protein A
MEQNMSNYSVEDLIRLEARIAALESYVKDNLPDGGWFLSQEYYKWLVPLAFQRHETELADKFLQEKAEFEERCRRDNIEIKFP